MVTLDGLGELVNEYAAILWKTGAANYSFIKACAK